MPFFFITMESQLVNKQTQMIMESQLVNKQTQMIKNTNTPLVFEKKKQSQIKKNTPLVFDKKQNKSLIRSLKAKKISSGLVRPYPPAAQEWYNSIYTYNTNYVKSIPALDNSLRILLKSYCNMWPKQKTFKKNTALFQKFLKHQSRLIGRKLKKKQLYDFKRNNDIKPLKLYKRLSPKKVFVGKGNLKHTSTKVIVTLYTYNIKKLHLLRKMRLLIFKFFLTKIPLIRIETVFTDRSQIKDNVKVIWVKKPGVKRDRGGMTHPGTSYLRNLAFFKKFTPVKNIPKIKNFRVLLYNRRLTLDEYLNSSYKCVGLLNWDDPLVPFERNIHRKLVNILPFNLLKKAERRSKLKIIEDPILPVSYFFNILNYTNIKIAKITQKLKKILGFYKYLTTLVEKKILNNNEKFKIFSRVTTKFNVYKFRNNIFVFTRFKQKKLYLASLLKFAWLLYINDVKFKHPVLVSRLKYLVNNLYDKEVEFNLVELKKMHLSSDIYTQTVALKLKNRNNKLYRVLKWSLRKIHLPNVSRFTERFSEFNRDEYLANKIRNKYINTMFEDKHSNSGQASDSLNNLLSGLFPSTSELTKEIRNLWLKAKIPVNLQQYVIFYTKNKKLAGIRVEAKGRLTRRFTAQRSVYKMRYKGGLKNVDSSFKGLPAVMIRGFLKSNVEYSIVQSKNRNGAFGVKGWVGCK